MFDSFSPFARLVCFILLFIALILASSISGYLLIILVLCFLILYSRLPFKTVFKSLWPLRYFFLLILLMNVFLSSVGEEPYFSWHFLSLSKESVYLGLRICFKTGAAVLLASLYTSSSSCLEIAGALTTLLSPLKVIKLPVDEIALMLSITLSSIPVIREECSLVIKAQTARGAGFEKSGLKDKASSIIPLIVPIFIVSLTRADELSLAMEARGYKGLQGRTKREKDRLSRIDAPALLFSLLVLCIQIIIKGVTL